MIDIENLKEWNIENLQNIVFFQEGPGVRNNQYTQQGVKLLNVANLKNGEVFLDNTERYISEEEAYGKYKHFLAEEGDLIIASSGIKVEYFDRKMGFVKKEHLPLCMNTSTIRFKTLDKEHLNIKYFAYFLKTDYFKKQISRLITGSAQLNFGPSHLRKIKVIVPPINIQNKIVQVLDKAQQLIDKRKEQIEALDELVKSKFIEMFGSQKYPLVKAEDICEYITKGTTPKSSEIIEEYNDDLIPYLKVYNLSFDGSMLFDEKAQYITLETHNKFLARSKVYPNDILMNIVGPPLGKFAIVPNTFSEWNINQAIAIFRATNKVNPIYLLYFLKQPKVLKPFIDSAVGIRQQNLSLLQCRNLEIQLPPLSLQNQFADFVNKVNKLKSEMEKSLKELEDNFNSLMQKSFKGELFN